MRVVLLGLLGADTVWLAWTGIRGRDLLPEERILWVVGGVVVRLLRVALAVSETRRGLWVGVTIIAAIAIPVALTLYQPIGRKAMLAADRGTLAALRSAIGEYAGVTRIRLGTRRPR